MRLFTSGTSHFRVTFNQKDAAAIAPTAAQYFHETSFDRFSERRPASQSPSEYQPDVFNMKVKGATVNQYYCLIKSTSIALS